MTHSPQQLIFDHLGAVWKVRFYSSIEQLKGVWPSVGSGRNALMSIEFLGAIEEAPPKDIDFLYAALYNPEGRTVGLYYFQYKPFNAAESINYTKPNSTLSSFWNRFRHWVASLISSYGLVSGNLLITGNHGIIWLDQSIDLEEKRLLHIQTYLAALQHSGDQGKKIGFILSKDHIRVAPKQNLIRFNSVKVQPNMLLNLDPAWQNFDDYLAAMRSKYRRRHRSARRKVSNFDLVEVELDEITEHIDTIYNLYLEIVDRAPFNMFILSKNYFINLKEHLGSSCDFTLVFNQNMLVAFQINIVSNGEYESHFLGYDHKLLQSHDIYLNLLLHTVELGIKRKVKTIVFSRTAMQIKSSIGAIPEEMYLYLELRNPLMNLLVKLAFYFLSPSGDYEQRHPFKRKSAGQS